MGHSIQDNLQKINSRLSLSDTISLGVTALFLILFAFYCAWLFRSEQKPVVYRTEGGVSTTPQAYSRPFGSKNGTTYTYSWCQGSDRIKPENMIYFDSSNSAEASGRTLSKLCGK